jgi:hypothetical protein
MGNNNRKIRNQKSITISWKAIFILLLIGNVMFYVVSNAWYREILRGESTLVYFSLATALNIINTLVVSLYIWKRHPQGKVKIISYTALIFLALRMGSGILFLFWMVIASIFRF